MQQCNAQLKNEDLLWEPAFELLFYCVQHAGKQKDRLIRPTFFTLWFTAGV